MSLTAGGELAWHLAAAEAHAVGHALIEPVHLLIGLCGLEHAVLAGRSGARLGAEARAEVLKEHDWIKAALAAGKLEPDFLRAEARESLTAGSASSGRRVVSRSPAVKAMFAQAEAGPGRATAMHLLAALLRSPVAEAVPGLMHADRRAIAAALLLAAPAAEARPPRDEERRAGAPGFLERFGRDLTLLAREGKLPPFVGRREILLQVVQTLARSTKNNPVLVGEAGVGKTAVVEALAARAAAGKDPAVLGGKRIVELSLGALVAGTKMRGELEERLEGVLAEAKADRDLIVFIDELHALVGAGDARGGLDAANLLKPALARGDFRCIGATTVAEYRRHIEADPALERRFERIEVPEPSPDEALAMLEGLKGKWEAHHQVELEPGALVAAVDLSVRFDGDHRLPDKAIDLVDRACARARVPQLSQVLGGPAGAKPKVGAKAVAELLALKSGLPVDLVAASASGGPSRLLALEGFLNARVLGQEEAVGTFCRRLLMAHSGLGDKRGPLAVFLLLGPTGVGKTQLVRSLAEFLFGDEKALIRLDMSEYMEEHSTAKLIGSPPGYVGYEEEGQLTAKLRSRPYSVVLLDEVEKSHPRVLDLFLQLFDEGRLTDAKGRTVDARNSVFVMTSNLGAEQARDKKSIGFADPAARQAETESFREAAEAAVRARFRPELLNRVDERVVFRHMTEQAVRAILKPMLAETAKALEKEHGLALVVSPEAEALLARAGYSREYGVRELSRVVERLLKVPLTRLVLSKPAGRTVVVSADFDALRMTAA